MKSTIARIMVMCCLAFSLGAWAQSDSGMGGAMKNDNMKSDAMSKKAMSITGKISDDGKTFTSEKDGKNWMISNPEAVKGHEGHEVTVKAHVDAGKNEIHVTSVKMANAMKDNMKKDQMKNDQMKNDNMSH